MTTGQRGPAQTEETDSATGALDVAGATGAGVVTAPAEVALVEATGTTGLLLSTHMGPGHTGADVGTTPADVALVTTAEVGTTGALVVAGQLGEPGQTMTLVGITHRGPGQTTVDVKIELVLLPTGQLVTVGAQLVMVYSTVW